MSTSDLPSHEDSDPRFSDEIYQTEEYIYEGDEYHFPKAKHMYNCASVVFDMIKKIGLKKGASLTSVACPAPLLKRLSLLEMYSYISQPKKYLLGLHDLTAEERMINICKWWIENQMLIPQDGVQDVKPFNPILGEQFHCQYQHKDSVSTFVAEQVSHHPPITAVYIENKKEAFTFEQTHEPKSTFWGNSAYSVIEGPNVLRLLKLGEVYNLTSPDVNLKNLILGASYLTNDGKTTIMCSETGYYAEFEYKKKFIIQGFIMKLDGGDPKKGTVLYAIDGKVNGDIFIRKKEGKKDGKPSPFLSASTMQNTPRIVKPVHMQKKNESRRVWHGVTFGLYNRQFDTALEYKTKVEEFQRKLRKEGSFVYSPEYFEKTEKVMNNTPLYRYRNPLTIESISTANLSNDESPVTE